MASAPVFFGTPITATSSNNNELECTGNHICHNDDATGYSVGNLNTLHTAGASGGLVTDVFARADATTVQGMVIQLWISTDGGTNKYWLEDLEHDIIALSGATVLAAHSRSRIMTPNTPLYLSANAVIYWAQVRAGSQQSNNLGRDIEGIRLMNPIFRSAGGPEFGLPYPEKLDGGVGRHAGAAPDSYLSIQAYSVYIDGLIKQSPIINAKNVALYDDLGNVCHASLEDYVIELDNAVGNPGGGFTPSARTPTLDSISTGGAELVNTAEATVYYIWMISSGQEHDAIYSLSATNPYLPSGYRYRKLVGHYYWDLSPNESQVGQLCAVYYPFFKFYHVAHLGTGSPAGSCNLLHLHASANIHLLSESIYNFSSGLISAWLADSQIVYGISTANITVSSSYAGSKPHLMTFIGW